LKKEERRHSDLSRDKVVDVYPKKISLLGIVSIIFWLHINLEVQLGKYRSTRKVVDVYKKISLLDIVSIFFV
jgi:hypothetical protein